MTRPEALRRILALGGRYQSGIYEQELRQLYEETGREQYRIELEEVREARRLEAGEELQDAGVRPAQGELFGRSER